MSFSDSVESIKNALILVGVFGLIMGVSLVQGLENLRIYSMYYTLGIVLFRAKKKRIITETVEKIVAKISVAFFVFSIAVYFLVSSPTIKWLDFKFMGVVGCISFAYLSLGVKRWSRISSYLCRIGKNTLPVYAVHWCLLFSLDIPPLWKYVGAMPLYIIAMIGCILWLLTCWGLIYLFRKNKLTKHLLCGE